MLHLSRRLTRGDRQLGSAPLHSGPFIHGSLISQSLCFNSEDEKCLYVPYLHCFCSDLLYSFNVLFPRWREGSAVGPTTPSRRVKKRCGAATTAVLTHNHTAAMTVPRERERETDPVSADNGSQRQKMSGPRYWSPSRSSLCWQVAACAVAAAEVRAVWRTRTGNGWWRNTPYRRSPSVHERLCLLKQCVELSHVCVHYLQIICKIVLILVTIDVWWCVFSMVYTEMFTKTVCAIW